MHLFPGIVSNGQNIWCSATVSVISDSVAYWRNHPFAPDRVLFFWMKSSCAPDCAIRLIMFVVLFINAERDQTIEDEEEPGEQGIVLPDQYDFDDLESTPLRTRFTENIITNFNRTEAYIS